MYSYLEEEERQRLRLSSWERSYLVERSCYRLMRCLPAEYVVVDWSLLCPTCLAFCFVFPDGLKTFFEPPRRVIDSQHKCGMQQEQTTMSAVLDSVTVTTDRCLAHLLMSAQTFVVVGLARGVTLRDKKESLAHGTTVMFWSTRNLRDPSSGSPREHRPPKFSSFFSIFHQRR